MLVFIIFLCIILAFSIAYLYKTRDLQELYYSILANLCNPKKDNSILRKAFTEWIRKTVLELVNSKDIVFTLDQYKSLLEKGYVLEDNSMWIFYKKGGLKAKIYSEEEYMSAFKDYMWSGNEEVDKIIENNHNLVIHYDLNGMIGL